MGWEPSGAEATREEKRQRTRSIEDLYDDLEQALPGLRMVVLKYRVGPRAGRYRRWRNDYTVNGDKPDVEEIFTDILEAAEEIEERHGRCTFQTTCKVEANGEIKAYPPIVWELHNDDNGELQSEALQLIRQQTRVIRMQGLALSRQVQDVERASGSVVAMMDSMTRMDGNNVDIVKARLEHQRWELEQKNAENMAGQELDLVRDLAPKGLAVMAAREAREAATAANKGDKKALWKHAIKIAQQIRGRAAVQEVLGEKGTEVIDELGDATTKEKVSECMTEFQRLGSLKPDDPAYINLWNLIPVAPEIVPIFDMLYSRG